MSGRSSYRKLCGTVMTTVRTIKPFSNISIYMSINSNRTIIMCVHWYMASFRDAKL